MTEVIQVYIIQEAYKQKNTILAAFLDTKDRRPNHIKEFEELLNIIN